MPDLTEGLTVGGEPVTPIEEGSVQTQSGFDAHLAAAAARARGEDSPDTSETESGEQQGASGEPAETQTPSAEAQAAAQPGEEGERLFAGKYKSPEDLERAYEELNQLQGRQAQMFGERIAALEAQIGQDDDYEPVSTAPGEIDSMVETHGGQAVMSWAVQEEARGNVGLIEEVLDAWYDVDPKEARRFDREYQIARAAQPQHVQPQPLDPTLQQMALERKWVAMRNEFAAGDQTLAKAINDTLVDPGTPEHLRVMAMSGDDGNMRVALEHLTWAAKMRVAGGAYVTDQVATDSGQTTAAQAQAAAEAARSAELQDRKRETAIVSGARQLAPVGEPPASEEQERRREALQRFKQSIFDAPSTDISSGLTVNGQKVTPDLKLAR